MKRRALGLSLMEMLVVLVLVSMISVLLMEAVSFVFGRYARVQSHLEAAGEQYLPDNWFRRSVSNLVAASDSVDSFMGSERSFAGHSLSPILDRDGIYTRVRWDLVPEGHFIALYVTENENDSVVVRRWRAKSAKFSYLDTENSFQATWTEFIEGEKEPRLPRAVKLSIDPENQDRFEILAAVRLKPRATPDFRDAL